MVILSYLLLQKCTVSPVRAIISCTSRQEDELVVQSSTFELSRMEDFFSGFPVALEQLWTLMTSLLALLLVAMAATNWWNLKKKKCPNNNEHFSSHSFRNTSERLLDCAVIYRHTFRYSVEAQQHIMSHCDIFPFMNRMKMDSQKQKDYSQ